MKPPIVQDILGAPIAPGTAVVFALAESWGRSLGRGLVLAVERDPRSPSRKRPARFRVYLRVFWPWAKTGSTTIRINNATRVLVVPHALSDVEREELARHQFRRRPRRRLPAREDHEAWLRRQLDALVPGPGDREGEGTY
jgi:hypothetical protein